MDARRWNSLQWAHLVFALALVGAACRQPSSEGLAQAPITQGVSENSIKIGLFAPLTGEAAVWAKAQHMIEAIYREVNAQGGINGRQLELVVEDDQCDPATTKLVFSKLVERDRVFMIHGGICSNPLITILPDIQQSGIPFLVNSASTGQTPAPPIRNVFTVALTQPVMAESIASFLEEAAADVGNRLAIVAQQDEWGLGWVDGLKTYLDDSVKIVTEESIDIEAGDATAQVRRVLDAGADLVALFAYPQPFSAFLRDARAQGLTVPIVTGNTVQPDEQLERVGDLEAVMPMFSVYGYRYPVNAPEYEHYRELLAKYYPQDQFDSAALLAISGALVNIEILKRMGDNLTWENWIRTAEKFEGFETPVNISPVSFCPFDPERPECRRGARFAAFAHIDPSGSGLVVVPSWADWRGLAA